mmetsp:Transcript_94689/g.265144  ORF Transcript_94689/g.265144 Transcript_94689/m.265144 type:complete len:83 (+) Transcript_94689:635-883(+)
MYGEAKQVLKEEWALAQREDTRHDESAAIFFSEKPPSKTFEAAIPKKFNCSFFHERKYNARKWWPTMVQSILSKDKNNPTSS